MQQRPAGLDVVQLAEDVPGPLDKVPQVEERPVRVRRLHLGVRLDGLHELRQALRDPVAVRWDGQGACARGGVLWHCEVVAWMADRGIHKGDVRPRTWDEYTMI